MPVHVGTPAIAETGTLGERPLVGSGRGGKKKKAQKSFWGLMSSAFAGSMEAARAGGKTRRSSDAEGSDNSDEKLEG